MNLINAIKKLTTPATNIIIIGGPAAAGKSTITKLLSKRIHKSVRISVDEIWKNIINGYETPDKEKWNTDTFEQSIISRKIASLIAKTYIHHGYLPIIDDIVTTENFFLWKKLLSSTNTHYYLLDAPLNIIHKRNLKRKNKLSRKSINHIYKKYKILREALKNHPRQNYHIVPASISTKTVALKIMVMENK